MERTRCRRNKFSEFTTFLCMLFSPSQSFLPTHSFVNGCLSFPLLCEVLIINILWKAIEHKTLNIEIEKQKNNFN